MAKRKPDPRPDAAESIKGGSTPTGPAQQPGQSGTGAASVPAPNTPPQLAAVTGEAGQTAAPVTSKAGVTAPTQVVVVVGPKRGRWRAGRHFATEPVEIPLEDLSEVEKGALIGDPALSVTTIERPAES